MNQLTRACLQLVPVTVFIALFLLLGLLPNVLEGIFAPAPVTANEDAPTGGGMGCQSNGNCQGSVYKDKRNLDRWWYPVCSGCHTVQAPPPSNQPIPLSPNQRRFIGDTKAFWTVHGQAKTDPTLRMLLPKGGLKPLQTLPPEFRALVKR